MTFSGPARCKWLLEGRTSYPELLFLSELTRGRRPSIPDSDDEEIESCDRDGGGDGVGQWRPWADIAAPLLDVLLPRVSLLERVLLSSVCRPWHDFLAGHPSHRRPRFPWLMFQTVKSPSVRDFCSPSEDGFYTLRLGTPFDDGCYGMADMRCKAADHGWLLFSRDHGRVRQVFVNPLTKACIDLPKAPDNFVWAALSAAPTEPSCVAMCLAGGKKFGWRICYFPIRDKTWYVLPDKFRPTSNIAVMGEKFYVLCQEGLAEIDISQSCPLKWLKLNDGMLPRKGPWLVVSNGELLVVTLLRSEEHWHTPTERRGKSSAYVHRADFANKTWVKVENSSDRSLFLSRGSCFSLPAVDAGDHVGDRISVSGLNPIERHTKKCLLWREYPVHGKDKLSSNVYTMEYGCSGSIWFMPTI